MNIPSSGRTRKGIRYPKRLFDVLVSALVLILLAPVVLGVAVAVRLKLGHPVLFVQERPGLDGRPFRLVKFRTMLGPADDSGKALDDAARLTPFGEWLRSTSLDELPELWNVLKGDMSLVGPRPLLLDYLPLYTPFQMRRHEVRPGITGWSQVNGRNAVTWEERFEHDVWYVDHMSFLLDLRILLKTFARVIFRKGISADGSATMPRFVRSRVDEGERAK